VERYKFIVVTVYFLSVVWSFCWVVLLLLLSLYCLVYWSIQLQSC